MKYEIKVGQETGDMLGVILEDNGDIVEISEFTFQSRKGVIYWIVRTLERVNPEGTCRLTRKKVYNERVVGKPGFWEITAYNAKGDYLGMAQWSDVMQEGYLRGLVAERFGFPLEAAEEIE